MLTVAMPSFSNDCLADDMVMGDLLLTSRRVTDRSLERGERYVEVVREKKDVWGREEGSILFVHRRS